MVVVCLGSWLRPSFVHAVGNDFTVPALVGPTAMGVCRNQTLLPALFVMGWEVGGSAGVAVRSVGVVRERHVRERP